MADGRGPAGGDPCERKSLQELVKDATWQELSQYPDDAVSAAEIKAMLDKRASRRRSRRIRGFGAAALFVLVIAAALFAYNTIAEDVEADKNAPEEIVTEDGVVIEDGGWGSSSEDMLVINDWDDIAIAKEHVDNLLVPEYIPEGYVFDSLTVEKMEGNSTICVFNFLKGEEVLEIQEYVSKNNSNALEMEDIYLKIDSNKGPIYIKENEDIKIATIQMNDGVTLFVKGHIKNTDISKIVEGFKD
ncbi:MAG: DUF4367 domain-containing protein [Bacillota bacterium]|nr:DUF4367 domain-containing protein [Bacillota bacterium]